jgi:Cof subfamily protein (haloacid dehalogenase superfamily)
MSYKMLISDIDGTLVEDGNEFHESLIRRIQEFKLAGGLFTIATGRTPQSARGVVERLGVDLPVIYMNGALVMEPGTDEIAGAAYIQGRILSTLLPWLDANGHNSMAFSHKSGLATRISDETVEFAARANDRLTLVPSWDSENTRRIHKVLVLAEDSPERAFLRDFPDLQGAIKFVRTGHGTWEVAPEGVSKGSAAKRLVCDLGLRMSEVVTVGDQMNDIEMTRLAGCGVAVNNAAPELKRVADAITGDRCWRGVCEVLDTVLLNQATAGNFHRIPAVCVAN